MTNNELRGIMEVMRARGWFEYGAVTPAEEFRALIGIRYPETGTKERFDALELEELSAVDFIRVQLLKEGRFLKKDGSAYRILLPSENANQIRLYMQAAQKKLSRAIKLGKHTPGGNPEVDSAVVRAVMKKESIRGR